MTETPTVEKKFLINDLQRCVEDLVVGLLYSDPHLSQVEGYNVVVRKDINEIKNHQVTLLSGGGSGHEPAHAGFIGDGMLSGAVLGNIFASPSVASILAAIRVVAGKCGVLLIVKNYTGDRLNFGMAMELAIREGIKCHMVVVDDDCALPAGKGITGGRGIAGTVLVHKIAGAAAKLGYKIEKVREVALKAVKSMKTLGVALSTCTIPGTNPSARLNAPQSIEIGMGIHGEPGREKSTLSRENNAAKQVASVLAEGVLSAIQPFIHQHPPKSSKTGSGGGEVVPHHHLPKLVLLVNNLGALPMIEMGIMMKEIIDSLLASTTSAAQYDIVRVFQGSFMTSLDMNGLSVTLLPIADHYNDDLLPLLDYHTNAPAWPHLSLVYNPFVFHRPSRTIPYTSMLFHEMKEKKIIPQIFVEKNILLYILKICENIIANEEILTRYDQICGDGDCGLLLRKGSEKITEMIHRIYVDRIEEVNVIRLLNDIADTISEHMGGTSGVLLELCFRSMANYFMEEVSCLETCCLLN
jgi:dihydroxyacetone kinase